MSNNVIPFHISRRKLDQENQALRQQIQYLLRQNNNLGRINVSALNCIERVENIVKALLSSPAMPIVGVIWRRLFPDLAIVVGQTSRFTVRDEKGNYLVKADQMPDSALVEKAEEEIPDEEEQTGQTGVGADQKQERESARTEETVGAKYEQKQNAAGCANGNAAHEKAAKEDVVTE